METIINPVFNNPVTTALGHTLLHSLWMGIILAVVTGAIIILTKKATAALRYQLLVGVLFIFTMSVVAVFVWQLQDMPAHAVNQHYLTKLAATQGQQTAAPGFSGRGYVDLYTGLFGYLSSYCNIIVLLWFMVICAKGIGMLTGLRGLHQLKTKQVTKVGIFWQDKLEELAGQLNLKANVQLLESGLAKVPMVIGHLKPVILIPLGLINALSAAEVEAILLHELAHISRRDYLVNLLQSLVEVIFFFNPAVLWISGIIKNERENCCDDMVTQQAGNKVSYIRALVSCQEFQSEAPRFALGINGKKQHLLGRVKRLVNKRNHTLNITEKVLLTLCLAAAIIAAPAFSRGLKNKVAQVVDLQDGPQAKVDSKKMIADLTKSRTIANSGNFTLKLTNTELLINGVKQPDSLHKKVMDKYVQHPERRLNYTCNVSTTTN